MVSWVLGVLQRHVSSLMLVYCFSPRVPFVTQCLLLQSNLSSTCMKICKDIVGLYLHCCFPQTASPNNRLFAVIVHVLMTGETCCQQIPCEKIVCDAGYYWMQLYAEKFYPNLGQRFFFFFAASKNTSCVLNQFSLQTVSHTLADSFVFVVVFIMIYPDWFPSNLHFLGDSRFSMWTAKVITAARPV